MVMWGIIGVKHTSPHYEIMKKKLTRRQRRRRYELSNSHWESLRPLLPHLTHNRGSGRPWKPHRRILNGIRWILHTGAPWRDLPGRYGPWETVYARFNRWREDGTWNKLLSRFLGRLDLQGRIDHELWCIDATIIRASRAAGGARRLSIQSRCLGGKRATQLLEPEDHALGRSQGGFGTKVHLLCDSQGTVLALYATAGQRHESKLLPTTLARVALPRRLGSKHWPAKLAGDKGYSYPWLRRWLKRHHIEDVIPTRKDQPRQEDFDKETYRQRNIVERAIGWLKECRRLGTRYEKLAVNFLAFWIVGLIGKILRMG
jgi:transposase